MAFIKIQKLVRDNSGKIISGSAAIVDTEYVKTGAKSHYKHIVREKLGKVLYISEDKKSGIFISPTRGLVEYNSVSDSFNEIESDDTRIEHDINTSLTEIHTVFGDTFLFLNFLKKSGLIAVLRSVFPKDEDYQRILCHLMHSVLKDGSHITCDNFIMKSFASYLINSIFVSSLKTDTRFYSMMGSDKVKVSFFQTFIKHMQQTNPDFGKGCYVDSTPLPNEIENNPFNALCCHGVSSSEVMTRLIMVLDEKTGLPVWFDIIPGNVLDINTVMTTINDVAVTLNIEIDSLVLDAGYISKEVISAFHIGTDKTIIGRMPARKGYPYKTLYCEVKDIISKGKYAFVRNRHAYFGYRKEIKIFDERMYAYIYVDKYNALHRFSSYLADHEEEYSEMKAKDKDWMTVKYGYFVLLSNIDSTPKDLLSEYFGRTDIEHIFKTSKEYLDLLPLSKWSDLTVRGKILHDIIGTIALLQLRKALSNTGISTTEIFGKTQSLMCYRDLNENVIVEMPCKQVKKYYNFLGVSIPSHINLKQFSEQIFL